MANPYSYFPTTYQPQMYPYQNQPQNNGFISVRSEDEARTYPVAPGNSVTFKNEVEPYLYTKTKGAEPFGEPTFTKYKLVKEEAKIAPVPDEPAKSVDMSIYALKSDIDAIMTEIDAIKVKMSEKVKEGGNDE